MFYESRERALGDAHRLERDVRDVVPDAMHCAARLLAREGGEIDMREDELGMRGRSVEALARGREEARAAPRFIARKREESGEERERGEDKNEMCHDV